MLKEILLKRRIESENKEKKKNLSKCKFYISRLFRIDKNCFSLQDKGEYIKVIIDEYVFRYYTDTSRIIERTGLNLSPVYGCSRCLHWYKPTFYQMNKCPKCNREIPKRIDNYIYIENLQLDEAAEHYCEDYEKLYTEEKDKKY